MDGCVDQPLQPCGPRGWRDHGRRGGDRDPGASAPWRSSSAARRRGPAEKPPPRRCSRRWPAPCRTADAGAGGNSNVGSRRQPEGRPRPSSFRFEWTSADVSTSTTSKWSRAPRSLTHSTRRLREGTGGWSSPSQPAAMRSRTPSAPRPPRRDGRWRRPRPYPDYCMWRADRSGERTWRDGGSAAHEVLTRCSRGALGPSARAPRGPGAAPRPGRSARSAR